MPVTMQQVLAALRPDEPDYDGARNLGPEALPHLEQLIQGDEAMLGSKAAYLTGLIGGPRSGPILMGAAARDDATVRAATAAAAAHLPPEASAPVLERLLKDAQADVRRIAIGSVPPDAPPRLRSALERSARTDPDPSIRGLSQEALRRVHQRAPRPK